MLFNRRFRSHNFPNFVSVKSNPLLTWSHPFKLFASHHNNSTMQTHVQFPHFHETTEHWDGTKLYSTPSSSLSHTHAHTHNLWNTMVQFTSFTPTHTFSSICEHTCKNLLGGNEGGKSKATKPTHTLTHLHTQTSLRWTFSFLSHFLNWRWLLWAKDGWMNGRQQRSTFGHFWSPSLSRNRSRRNFFFCSASIFREAPEDFACADQEMAIGERESIWRTS